MYTRRIVVIIIIIIFIINDVLESRVSVDNRVYTVGGCGIGVLLCVRYCILCECLFCRAAAAEDIHVLYITAAAAAVDAAKTAKTGRDHATASSFCPEKTRRRYYNNNEGFIICYFTTIL